jgi:hypothetical protein
MREDDGLSKTKVDAPLVTNADGRKRVRSASTGAIQAEICRTAA